MAKKGMPPTVVAGKKPAMPMMPEKGTMPMRGKMPMKPGKGGKKC